MTRHIFLIYHPAVALLFIAGAVVCAMLTLQPLYVAMSFACGSAYAVYLNGARQYFSMLKWMLILFAVVAVLNPLFNQRGFTVLFKLGNNPVTLEALCYGLAAGGMLLAVFVWFTCYNALITNEKFLFLFGRLLPTVALMIAMVLKLIPQSVYKARCIQTAQTALNMGIEGGRRQKIARGIRMSGILMSWSMEDCVETADSMRARGYGAGRRTTFSRFRMGRHDIVSTVVLCVLLVANLYLICVGANVFSYYPRMTGFMDTPLPYVLYAAMLCYPLLLEGKEKLLWKP